MNLLLYLISFSFSFFFIFLSYWKEDRIFNIIGSLMSVIIVIILIGTGIQITELKTISQSSYVLINNTSITDFMYSPISYSYDVSYLENIGIGVLISVFILLQYLYFTFMHSEVGKI